MNDRILIIGPGNERNIVPILKTDVVTVIQDKIEKSIKKQNNEVNFIHKLPEIKEYREFPKPKSKYHK